MYAMYITNTTKNVEQQDEDGVITQTTQTTRATTTGVEQLGSWTNNVVIVLLQLMIERNFHSKYQTSDNTRKNRLWPTLHNLFCRSPVILQHARAFPCSKFAEIFRTVKYIRDEFQKIKRNFRRVVADTTRTGSGDPPSQERYPLYDDMKNITLCDPSFWLPALHKLDAIVNGALGNLMEYNINENGTSYTVTAIETAEMIPIEAIEYCKRRMDLVKFYFLNFDKI
ncbi:hypothetical protein PHYBLDRAFT_149103 [Phycomyces blakesleeanus NRRL 1555(-)]|uniref:Uncharacterized protein n=1 Tax=Phycomyces blakesleeanus (strain ATCC 8743b / DSM 1359 / FGSC 10004 / NBRC 33097 / NRRL 1555) TaxID=763407 RepID=A0A162TNT7_PHYB8|nr:hypothetical protein PHYBLDRAFT_149103 [Phycomyces blakesleeanus NRRL 1555(-)]OAD69922.1 hypothetical protein PHYBLDRAFT_149103 [Phycomyces blakesleeanus NRRL 1555(-)]|eukprot:XP_018287962.1 hypothetical protein PHYBLDRAFT_149103 [Phycomyces blakesleeanus NRRL 1555(-)]